MLYVNPQTQPGFKAFEWSPGAKGREAEALKQYEQLFLFQMLKEMRKTVPDYGFFDSGGQKAYFEEMMDDFMAGEMAASGQLGVAKQMEQQLHAREHSAARATQPGDTHEMGRIQPRGIRLEEEYKGIAITGEVLNGIELERRAPGMTLKRAPEAGIPLSRAHEYYRANQDP